MKINLGIIEPPSFLVFTWTHMLLALMAAAAVLAATFTPFGLISLPLLLLAVRSIARAMIKAAARSRRKGIRAGLFLSYPARSAASIAVFCLLGSAAVFISIESERLLLTIFSVPSSAIVLLIGLAAVVLLWKIQSDVMFAYKARKRWRHAKILKRRVSREAAQKK